MCTEKPGVNRHIPGECNNRAQLISRILLNDTVTCWDYRASVVDEGMSMEHDTSGREIKVLGVKRVPTPLCPPQSPHRMTWHQTVARGQQLTAKPWHSPVQSIWSYCVPVHRHMQLHPRYCIPVHSSFRTNQNNCVPTSSICIKKCGLCTDRECG
jgi:hypothetical protein